MGSSMIVTGGAGFIGANFVRLALARTGDRVIVLDKLTYAGNLESLRDVERDPRFTFVHGDICEGVLVAKLLAEHRPTRVVNFAAESHVDRSIDGPGEFVQTNTVGAFALLDASRRWVAELPESERRAFRFLHVSTDEVYGTLGPTGTFSETTPYAPNSPYAASKAGADHLVRAYHETYGLPTLLTNCSNNYGPFQYPEKLIPLVLLNALEGKALPIYGDGLNVRDWLFVEDHCEGILRVLERGVPGQKYNIGGHGEMTNLALVDTLCALLDELRPVASNPAFAGRSEVRRYADLKTFVADRPGHDRRYAIDATKITRELGWKPSHAVTDGLAATVRWYLDNRAWCDAVQRGKYARERLGGVGASADAKDAAR